MKIYLDDLYIKYFVLVHNQHYFPSKIFLKYKVRACVTRPNIIKLTSLQFNNTQFNEVCSNLNVPKSIRRFTTWKIQCTNVIYHRPIFKKKRPITNISNQ